MPDAPRWLNKVALAAHLSITDSSISRLVRNGRIPRPSYHLGPRSPRWDREAVDAAFIGTPKTINADAAFAALSQSILQRGAERRALGLPTGGKANRSKG